MVNLCARGLRVRSGRQGVEEDHMHTYCYYMTRESVEFVVVHLVKHTQQSFSGLLTPSIFIYSLLFSPENHIYYSVYRRSPDALIETKHNQLKWLHVA